MCTHRSKSYVAALMPQLLLFLSVTRNDLLQEQVHAVRCLRALPASINPVLWTGKAVTPRHAAPVTTEVFCAFLQSL